MAAGGKIQVPGYDILEELGSGTYATVYKAYRSVSDSSHVFYCMLHAP